MKEEQEKLEKVRLEESHSTSHRVSDGMPKNLVLNQAKRTASLKLASFDSDFVDDILSTLSNAYEVIPTSRLMFGKDSGQYFIFCSVAYRKRDQ